MFFVGLVACLAAAPAPAHTPAAAPAPADTFLAQLAATRRFRDGQPNAVALTPDGSAVLFLRSAPRGAPVQNLYALDVASGKERVLLTADAILGGKGERLTAEERARRERQRQTARGIVSYELSDDGRRILVPLAGRIFVIDRAAHAAPDGATRELKGAAGFPLDPRFSRDASQVACVRDHDLYVIDVASGRERRLTEGGGETASNGEAEFVAQEEMAREHGYWWSPDGRTIAYEHSDVSHVEKLRIADPAHPEKPPQEWPYPRPGKDNADVTLGLIPATGGATTWVKWDRARYPYLASVDWPEHGPLTILVQNRTQTEEALLAVEPASGATTSLLVERDSAWLNLFKDMPRWLERGDSFLWMTERNGATQLELRARDGHLLRALTKPEPGLRPELDLDERHGMVWTRGGPDPTESQIFQVPLAAGGKPAPFTREPGLHGVTFAKDHGVLVHELTPLAGSPRWSVQARDGRVLGELTSVAETPSLAPSLEFTTAGDSLGCRAVIVRPRAFDPARRYPVIVSVYGGPHSQTVQANSRNYLGQQWLADHGFIVVSIDGRGTPNRGRAWERAIKNDLIRVPLHDQAAALEALGRRYHEMDLARVGIYGWSFGGYFSVLAVERRPAVFHAAVAGAPVTDWLDYDTHYTERYMGLPDRNAAGYRESSALTWAKDLERPLLILHGTADDNVYFLHSLKLCDALMRAGKHFEFVPFRGYTHSVADSLGVTQVNQRIVEHFTRNLGGPTPVAR
ncbi:MAG: DPP IV N-terminal domain-containing protein [Candidatus Eisenbacteria bacterium]|nr:DPP IV N-terminal domain-containing protein [Candidatus Eisenbacteria bacterium]